MSIADNRGQQGIHINELQGPTIGQQPRPTPGVFLDPRLVAAEGRVNILFKQIQWFNEMTVTINDRPTSLLVC